MAKARCGLGFDCASMMQSVGINPKNCENYKTCGAALEYEPGDELELVRIINEQRQRFRVTRHQAALMMLMERGNSQTLSDFEVIPLVEELGMLTANLATLLQQDFTEEYCYIAPSGCTPHRYNVKRKYERVVNEGGQQVRRVWARVYWYNKLLSGAACFTPVVEEQQVRVIHLSHDHDPRNLEARRGVERRNRLEHLRTQLRNLTQDLQEAIAELQLPLMMDSPLDAMPAEPENSPPD
jgi:hypothetical protein